MVNSVSQSVSRPSVRPSISYLASQAVSIFNKRTRKRQNKYGKLKWATLAAGGGADVDTIKKKKKKEGGGRRSGEKPQRNAHAQHAMPEESPKLLPSHNQKQSQGCCNPML